MSKKEGKPITKAKKSTLATTKKKARVLPNKKEGKQEITAIQSQWELINDSDKKLSTKHLMFVLEYCVDYNATRAYKEVYKCSDEVANAKWPELVVKDSIKEAIAKYMLPKIEKLWLWAERALRNLQAIVNKCMQLETITQVMRYDHSETITDEDWKEKTVRYQKYKDEEVTWPFNPAGAIAAVERITKLLNIEWWDPDAKKSVKEISDKQKASILALWNAYKPPQAE